MAREITPPKAGGVANAAIAGDAALFTVAIFSFLVTGMLAPALGPVAQELVIKGGFEAVIRDQLSHMA